MIIAPKVGYRQGCGNASPIDLANNNETTMQQGVSALGSLRKCNLTVTTDYAKRLSILGFRNYADTSSRSESLRERSTIPMT